MQRRNSTSSALALAFVTVLVACAGPPPTSTGDPQQDALARLEADTGAKWSVRWHADIHTPAFLVGRTAPIMSDERHAAAAASAFFDTYKALFRLEDATATLRATATARDELGMVHVRFEQAIGGVPVEGGGLVAHFDRDVALVRVHGRYLPIAAPDLVPAVAPQAARDAALAAAHAKRPLADDGVFTVEAPTLVIDPLPAARLSWRVEVLVDDPIAPGRILVFLDAATGAVRRSVEALDTLEGHGTGVFGEPQTFEIVMKKSRYVLENPQAGRPASATYSAAGKSRLPGREVSSVDPGAWDLGGPGAGSAVDAQAFVGLVTDYYARRHGRAGALGDGKGIRATVHFGVDFANAFWNGKQLVFGDGGGNIAPLAGGLDVVAHEFTHAVSQASAGLGHEYEPGALNEAVSDIFACFIEHAVRPKKADWTVGEDVVRGGIRDLADPHRLGAPAVASEEVQTEDDNGGVHVNSTIPSHAAWLMTVGGRRAGARVTGVGIAAAERIWYRALTRYLSPTSDFRDAADATVAAADDLFGASSREAKAVHDAWVAVGEL